MVIPPHSAGSAAYAGIASKALGVEQFGQTGTIDDLYRHHGMDANAIIDAAESLTAGAAGAAPQNGGCKQAGPHPNLPPASAGVSGE